MATFAIGDIQGCFQTFQRLLARCGFQEARDTLWLAGDLVNRGPRSLEVLRWVYARRDQTVVVLGNHDLHLLSRAQGVAKAKARDTLDEVLHAPDRDPLLAWLKSQPLFYQAQGFVMVHAGLLPSWTLAEAQTRAKEAEAALKPDQVDKVLRALRKNAPEPLPEGLKRIKESIGIFTRVRMLGPDGRPNHKFAGPPEDAPPEHTPWFEGENVWPKETTILFGHWAALGFMKGNQAICLDSGCVWGQSLTALRLDDLTPFSEPLCDSTSNAP